MVHAVTSYTQPTQSAYWVGFSFMVAGALYVLRSSFRGRHKETRIFHYITALVGLRAQFDCARSPSRPPTPQIMIIASLAYLTMAIGSLDGNPYAFDDINIVQFYDWIVGTPLLLIDLAFLAKMDVPEVFFIVVVDILMIVSGYVSYLGTSAVGIWPLFVFSCVMQGVVVGTLVRHLYGSGTSPDVHPVENRVYRFLAVFTIVVWAVFPIKFALFVSNVMSLEVDVIIGCVLDILAKVIFGLILVGSREAMEGDQTPIALMSLAAIGLTVSEVETFVREYGEEHAPAAKPPRRRRSMETSALEAAASPGHVEVAIQSNSVNRRAAPTQAELDAAEAEMGVRAAAAPLPPLPPVATSASADHSVRAPQPEQQTQQQPSVAGFTPGGGRRPSLNSVPFGASNSLYRDFGGPASSRRLSQPKTPSAVPSSSSFQFRGADAAAANPASPGQPARRLSASIARVDSGGATPPAYAVRAPGRRGSALADAPDSLQSPSYVARVEAARRASLTQATQGAEPPPPAQEADRPLTEMHRKASGHGASTVYGPL